VPAALIGTLARCQWVTAGQPLVLIGDSGTGNSHLLIGLGTAAAEAGYRVRYVTAAALVNELAEAADERLLTKVIGRYGRVDLLCLDELGYIELDRRGAELLFQVFTEREEKNSIAVASNAAFSKAHMFTATCAKRRLKYHGFACWDGGRTGWAGPSAVVVTPPAPGIPFSGGNAVPPWSGGCSSGCGISRGRAGRGRVPGWPARSG
jgi:IstB-like ATP binding protein